MITKLMSKSAFPTPTDEEIVASALNEQGYLLHHRVLNAIYAEAQTNKWGEAWAVEAFEMPVWLFNSSEVYSSEALVNFCELEA